MFWNILPFTFLMKHTRAASWGTHDACESMALSAQIKTTVKRKLYEDNRVPLSSEPPQKTVKKTLVSMAATPSSMAPTSQAGLQRASSLPHTIKKSKTSGEQSKNHPQYSFKWSVLIACQQSSVLTERSFASDVTLSALNDSDANSDLVDMEGLGEGSTKKTNFDQGERKSVWWNFLTDDWFDVVLGVK